MDENNNNSNVIRKKQQHTLLVLAIVAITILIVAYFLSANRASPSMPKEKEEAIHFETPLTHVDAQSLWMERAQHELAQDTKATQTLNQQLQLLQQSKDVQDKNTQEQAQALQALQMQMETLQAQLAHRQSSASGNDMSEYGHSISDHLLKLSPSNRTTNFLITKNPLTFVPAGTFVRAIALGGADVSAGVTSQANPSPMLFRLLDRGTLPNHHQSQLKDCVATAAAIGDVSSERGEIRLERLSCTRSNSEIIEMPVEATVFGPDGKNGVRGNPLWREGALLQRAFAAGAFSGVSNGISHGYTSSSVNALGNAQTIIDGSKILQYGATNGLSNAAEKLAEYNVKRAEQYHPVIQLSAGTIVDIVFLKGFYLEDKKLSDEQTVLTPKTSIPEKNTADEGLLDIKNEDSASAASISDLSKENSLSND